MRDGLITVACRVCRLQCIRGNWYGPTGVRVLLMVPVVCYVVAGEPETIRKGTVMMSPAWE